jgi:hypothetical protein
MASAEREGTAAPQGKRLYRDAAWQVVRRMHLAADLSLSCPSISCHCIRILPNRLGTMQEWRLSLQTWHRCARYGITQPQRGEYAYWQCGCLQPTAYTCALGLSSLTGRVTGSCDSIYGTSLDARQPRDSKLRDGCLCLPTLTISHHTVHREIL